MASVPVTATANTSQWESIALRKRAERASKIPKEWLLPATITDNPTASPASLLQSCGLLSQRESYLTDPDGHDAISLLQKLANSEITSTELVTAFCKRAAIAQQLSNCLTEILFDEAIARAHDVDKHLQRTGQVLGPLHGLPVTFKDSFDIQGQDSSIGIMALCYSPAQQNSLLYDILTGYGAIVIAKTTVPQTMLNADTDSIVFGRTVHPYNRLFGVAGSTGGEGALLALGGSACGVGSDGAGSVRMPAAVNGVVGYKPSGYRLPLDGRGIMGTGVMGTTTLGPVSVAGFLTRSVRDARLFTKLAANAQPWQKDPCIYPHLWQSLPLPTVSHLRIGVWSSNNFLHLHPPVQRGFTIAQDRLRHAGVQLVDFPGPDISGVWELQKEWTEIQDLSYLRELLSMEPHTKIVKATAIITKKTTPPPLTLPYLHSLNVRIRTLLRRMHDAWNSDGTPIDALLWVPAPHTAVPFDQYTYLGFTGLFNLIDWPAMALPLGMSANRQLDTKTPVTPFNDLDAEVQEIYHADSFHGLPLSVQLIGRRFEDEKLLAVSQVVHDIIRPTGLPLKL
ncbi:amidase signature domain-containing protein [Aspergillus coremiiformis]|uniref:Amidase signature domain-containing protein n=1 Tax=Aspergillus coremiiformis TaxID=138285 RepID=A0A5N6Z3Z6_9EURO|nr:amidase signature domain-containing protein [Aspergillus coremiiformis]